MTLEQLKEKVLKNQIDNGLMIFKYDSDTFIIKEYIDKIALDKGLTINYIHELSDLNEFTSSMFFDYDQDYLNLYYIEELKEDIPDKFLELNCIIICNKIDKAIERNLTDHIVEFPKLENWQIEEYAKVRLHGVNETITKWLCEVTNHDIYRLENEIDKISIFDEIHREDIFTLLNEENNYSDLNNFNIFNLISAITKKDFKAIIDILKIIDLIDVEPVGLITLLLKQFKQIINVKSGTMTYEQLGMSQKQYNAIKYYNKLDGKTLIKGYELLSSIDYRLKNGSLDNDKIIDYVICNILK